MNNICCYRCQKDIKREDKVFGASLDGRELYFCKDCLEYIVESNLESIKRFIERYKNGSRFNILEITFDTEISDSRLRATSISIGRILTETDDKSNLILINNNPDNKNFFRECQLRECIIGFFDYNYLDTLISKYNGIRNDIRVIYIESAKF